MVLTQASSAKYEDRIAYLTNNKYEIPTRLTVGNDGKGTVFYADEAEYLTFQVDPETMTGTATYTNNSKTVDIFVTVNGDTLTLYDTTNNKTLVYGMADKNSLSSLSGDMVLTQASNAQHEDSLAYWTNNKYKLSTRLTVGSDGKGTVFYMDDTECLSFQVDPETMTGKATYTSNSKTTDIFVTVNGDTLAIYDSYYHSTRVFRTEDGSRLSSFGGDMVLTQASNAQHEDSLAYWTNNKYKLSTRLTVGSDGKGTVLYMDDTECLSFQVDPETMTGTATYTSNSKTTDIFVTVNGDTLAIYDSYYHSTRVFRTEDEDSLSGAMGDYTVTAYSSKDHADYLKYLDKNGYKVPATVVIAEDGTGTVKYEDGKSFFTFTCDPLTMTGKLVFTKNKKESQIYIARDGDKIALYSSGDSTTLTFEKTKKE